MSESNKIEWYGEITDDWFSFSNQEEKGYVYDSNMKHITAATQSNSGSIADSIIFKVDNNDTLEKREGYAVFRQKDTDYEEILYIMQEAGTKEISDDNSVENITLTVNPKQKEIDSKTTEYQFSATLQYTLITYWKISGTNTIKDENHVISSETKTEDVTDKCAWTTYTDGVDNKGNGLFVFGKNKGFNNRFISAAATYKKYGKIVNDVGSVIQGLSNEKQYTGDPYVDTSVSKFTVEPDGANLSYSATNQNFTAKLTLKWLRDYVIPSEGKTVKKEYFEDDTHKFYDNEDVTSLCTWSIDNANTTNPDNVKIGANDGKCTFDKNFSPYNRNIYVKANFNYNGNNFSDEGNVVQGSGERVYQLLVNGNGWSSITMDWKFNEVSAKTLSVISTYHIKNDESTIYPANYSIEHNHTGRFTLKTKEIGNPNFVDYYEIQPSSGINTDSTARTQYFFVEQKNDINQIIKQINVYCTQEKYEKDSSSGSDDGHVNSVTLYLYHETNEMTYWNLFSAASIVLQSTYDNIVLTGTVTPLHGGNYDTIATYIKGTPGTTSEKIGICCYFEYGDSYVNKDVKITKFKLFYKNYPESDAYEVPLGSLTYITSNKFGFSLPKGLSHITEDGKGEANVQYILMTDNLPTLNK